MENLVDYENLIVDIVSRLPVESVLQCRCVCKSWRALLRETYFTQVHTDRTLHQQQQLLLLIDDYDDDDYDSSSSSSPVSFFNLVCFKETDSHEFHLQDYYVNKYISSSKVSRPLLSPPPSLRKEDEDQGRSMEQILLSKLCPSIEKKMDWEIVGSCNGLICLYGFKSTYYDYNYYNTFPFIIYNPITREYLKLPLVDHSQCTTINNDVQYVTCGFGYHPSTKEYKIVRIIYQRAAAAGSESSSYVIWVQIYTLGGRSSSSEGKWRTKKEQEETCKDCLCSTTPGVPFNGALYWVRIVDRTVATLKKRTIISIDLADEKFQIIPSPPLSIIYYPCFRYSPRYGDVCLDTELGVLGQNLCISLRTNFYTDIWIMNNNNNTAECSWSKKFSIPATLAKPIGLNSPDGFPLYQSIGLTKKGRVLCIFDQKYLVSFDPITKSLKSLGCMRLFESQSRKIFYTKSFVSLKALGEENAEILKSVVAAPANANTNKKGTVGMQKQYYWRRRRRN